MLKQSPKQQARRNKYSKITDREKDWRAYRGESPNPWGVDSSDGFYTMQIISRSRISKLEARSLAK